MLEIALLYAGGAAAAEEACVTVAAAHSPDSCFRPLHSLQPSSEGRSVYVQYQGLMYLLGEMAL